ncbi:peptide chain release factor N(5)-glutamine methyltransferase [Novosphingobium sp.]|uniref:peptide chain release factor N(5)-glutamine methyltransferase n=1 Tax=Novosphingobium sp. TaxID=1874826 RepID=UPI003342A098
MPAALVVKAALITATRDLAPVSDTARLDAELLMSHALGVTRSDLIMRHMHDPVPDRFCALVERRLACEPVAYIIGSQPFWGIDLLVDPAVLIPRGDTETLIAAAVDRLHGHPPARVIDLGTGSGALLLAALHQWPTAQGIGIDRSPAALTVAQANADRLGLAARARLIHADWAEPGWARNLGQFDLVLANPPYVESGAVLDRSVAGYEPPEALFAGADGLDDYRRLIPQLRALLAPDGTAMIEIGWTQGDAVMALARAAGLAAQCHTDLAGRPRAIEIVVEIDQIPQI